MVVVLLLLVILATRTMIVLLGLRMVVWVLVVQLLLLMVVTGVVPVFVLKVSACGVRKQVREVIVRIVIVRGAITLFLPLLQICTHHHQVRSVRAVGGEGVGNAFREQEVWEFIGIVTTDRSHIFATFRRLFTGSPFFATDGIMAVVTIATWDEEVRTTG